MKQLKWLLPVTMINWIALLDVTCRLPPIVPVHINYGMEVDGYGSRWTVPAFGFIPVLIAAAPFILPKMSRRSKWRERGHETASGSFTPTTRKNVESILWVSMTVFMTAISWFPVVTAFYLEASDTLTAGIPIDFLILFPIGVLFIIYGNFMGVIKKNYWMGIRLPWTLRSEEVWRKTHRLAGYTIVAGGAVMCVLTALRLVVRSQRLSVIGMIAGLILAVGVPVVYSLILSGKE